jgi:hypothetical protein
LLRQRSVEARREKARRGELLVTAAVGYLKGEEQHWEKDPDLRVQEAVLLVFRKFLGRYGQIDWSHAVVDSCSVRAVFGGRGQVRIRPTGPNWAASGIQSAMVRVPPLLSF